MPNVLAEAAAPLNLQRALSSLDFAVASEQRRSEMLSSAMRRASGRERPGRYWKIDFDAIDYAALIPDAASAPRISAPQVDGLVACDLAAAARSHASLIAELLGSIAPLAQPKFGALALALCNTGAFVYVPRGAVLEDPIEIAYHARQALFACTLVYVERGAGATIIERITGEDRSFVCGNAEVFTAESASLQYIAEQQLPCDARIFWTRASKPGASSRVEFALAELGGDLSVGTIEVSMEQPGAEAQVTGLFFPTGNQHVDLISTVHHAVGECQSQTLVKSAASGNGQARYLGNIRIAPQAQGTQASLRDDALLLSRKAHIDSVPALEIAANDVKAYHGATVGEMDDEQVFYMTSRGITRGQAERMIALGFFEPAIERFPNGPLQERVRAALSQRIFA